jgi:tetratricopeptide (TPR) repeat protein
VLAISLRDRHVVASGQPLRLSPQFFQLYCLLAYMRVTGRQGYVSTDAIARLPQWSRARRDSVGKVIHRHVAAMRRAGVFLLESPLRGGTKLFRLRVGPEAITFDVPLAEVQAYLGLDLAASGSGAQAPEELVQWAWALVRARLALERGDGAAARAALDDAAGRHAPHLRDQVELLLLRSRVLEQAGDLDGALAGAQEALRLSDQGGDYLTQARAHIRLGFLLALLRQPARYREARAHYERAHRLLEGSRHCVELSQIATGLGHLARREGNLEAARAYFLAALEHAAVEGWAFGIQAGLFNVGLVEAERGDATRDPGARRGLYQQARRWLERAVEFTDTTGVGKYSGEALGVLAHVLLQLGKAEAALQWALAAVDRSRQAGNRKSEAVALEALAEALRGVGRHGDARQALEAASRLYRDLGLGSEADRLDGSYVRSR